MTDDQLLWTDPAWLAEASVWIDDQLKRHQIHRTGEIEQTHVRPWSTVLRAPTHQGSFYFKALPENLQHEVAVVAALGERFPNRVPRLLAFDRDRGWMLQYEGGTRFRRELKRAPDVRHWYRVLSNYGEMQVALAEENQVFSSWGVPDRRPSRLPSLIQALLDDREALHIGHPDGLSAADLERLNGCLNRLHELCDELSDGPVPSSLDHGDLHDGNIFLRDGDVVIFDWGDCSLTHPFFSIRTVSVSVESRFGWEENDPRFIPLVDRYLNEWASFGTLEDLREVMRLAQILAPLVGALRWHRALISSPKGSDDYVEPVPRLLEEFLDQLMDLDAGL